MKGSRSKSKQNHAESIRVLSCGYCLDGEWTGDMHRHPNVFEILYITSGKGRTFVNGVTYPVSNGDLIMHRAAEWHYERANTADFAAIVISYRITSRVMAPGIKKTVLAQENMEESLFQLFRVLQTEIDKRSADSRQLLTSLAQSIYFVLMRLTNVEDSVLNKHNICQNTLRYLEANYGSRITLDLLAQHMGHSKYYLSHIIKELHGQPPMQLLTNVRIRVAKRLLVETSLPIAVIATHVGYVDPSSFCRLFKRMVGKTPGEYRMHSS